MWQRVADVVPAPARLCAVLSTQRDRIVHLAPSSTVSLWPILLSPADSTLPPPTILNKIPGLFHLWKGLVLSSHPSILIFT